MNTADFLHCVACGNDVSIEVVPSTCPACGGILDLQLADGVSRTAADEPTSLWQWAEFLPQCSRQNRMTLGEARSPLLHCPRLGEQAGLADLWIKNDSVMPTGSFKDRAIALATSLAKEHRREGLVLSSSGNAGASAAAYAARAGLPIVVLVPATAPEAKLRQIAAAGATLIPIDGRTSDCCRLADRLAHERGWVNLTTTYHNPYGVDAYATIAYEIAQIDADVVLLPISSGPLLAGVMKGFHTLLKRGRIKHVPRPIAVQAEACAPIVQAYREGGSVRPWPHRPTVASALNDTLEGYERDGDYTLEWIQRFNGAAVAVDDKTILTGARTLAEAEGILAEPSAAVPIAALELLRVQELVHPRERVVAVATGHGLKDLSWIDANPASRPLPPDFAALSQTLE